MTQTIQLDRIPANRVPANYLLDVELLLYGGQRVGHAGGRRHPTRADRR